ncbi:hypothetical protein ES703_58184 [subsurface metagenome]
MRDWMQVQTLVDCVVMIKWLNLGKRFCVNRKRKLLKNEYE